MTQEDLEALTAFIAKYPNWWWQVGACTITRDFSCAPEPSALEVKYISLGNKFDTGFHTNSRGSIADAITETMRDIESDIKAYERIFASDTGHWCEYTWHHRYLKDTWFPFMDSVKQFFRGK